MMSWQVLWESHADTGNGPLRASGYGDSPETARADLLANLNAKLTDWAVEASSHVAAVSEARGAIR